MRKTIIIVLEDKILNLIDRLVGKGTYPSRHHFIEEALQEKLWRIAHHRLTNECGNLDISVEKCLAEAGLDATLSEWPEY